MYDARFLLLFAIKLLECSFSIGLLFPVCFVNVSKMSSMKNLAVAYHLNDPTACSTQGSSTCDSMTFPRKPSREKVASTGGSTTFNPHLQNSHLPHPKNLLHHNHSPHPDVTTLASAVQSRLNVLLLQSGEYLAKDGRRWVQVGTRYRKTKM